MSIEAKHIEAALRAVPYGYGGQAWSMGTLARGADKAAAAAGITTREGAACLVAQCMVESAYFRTTREYDGSAGRYAPFYGRGFIQLTWERNYRSMGRWARRLGLISDSEAFVKNPDLLAHEDWAWLVAVFYLTENNLIGLANDGHNLRVGMGIHAGDPHADRRGYPWSDAGRNRIKHTKAAYRALLAAGITAPGPARWTPTGDMTTRQIQAELGLTVDGDYGPATNAAVKELQEALGLTADGQWGPITEEKFMSLQDQINDLAKDVKKARTAIGKVDTLAWHDRLALTQATLESIGWQDRENKTMSFGGLLMTTMRLSADASRDIKHTQGEIAQIADDVEALVNGPQG